MAEDVITYTWRIDNVVILDPGATYTIKDLGVHGAVDSITFVGGAGDSFVTLTMPKQDQPKTRLQTGKI